MFYSNNKSDKLNEVAQLELDRDLVKQEFLLIFLTLSLRLWVL